jgi:hypothetical protein
MDGHRRICRLLDPRYPSLDTESRDRRNLPHWELIPYAFTAIPAVHSLASPPPTPVRSDNHDC